MKDTLKTQLQKLIKKSRFKLFINLEIDEKFVHVKILIAVDKGCIVNISELVSNFLELDSFSYQHKTIALEKCKDCDKFLIYKLCNNLYNNQYRCLIERLI